ncbi:MAG: hypothetical protein ACFFCZ_18615 [Promethearchaeota archaeon]
MVTRKSPELIKNGWELKMSYDIHVDKDKKRIRLKLVGFLEKEQTESMLNEMKKYVESLGDS